MNFDTTRMFDKGKLTVMLDQSFGSSGKGKLGSFLAEHADNWQFCCNTNSPQAGHWVRLDDGRSYFYQTLNNCAYLDKYEKMYIGAGGMIELPSLFKEIEENNVPPHKLGISPVTAILQDIDAGFERGELDLDGNRTTQHSGTMSRGSTCHGVGCGTARKILRKKNMKVARDIPELKEFICDVPGEVMSRLQKGQSGLLELSQGFGLSLNLAEFYPYCTSRSVTVSQGLSDMMLPPKYAGKVILNCRTYPIRINSNKYTDPDTGEHLTWDQIKKYESEGKKINIIEGNSGPWYDDQEELTWEEITKISGSPGPLMEITSVTKLPRRIATHSKKGLRQAITYNDAGHGVFLSINFVNYVDYEMSGKRDENDTTDKLRQWMNNNLWDVCENTGTIILCLGTGALTDDMIQLYR